MTIRYGVGINTYIWTYKQYMSLKSASTVCSITLASVCRKTPVALYDTVQTPDHVWTEQMTHVEKTVVLALER